MRCSFNVLYVVIILNVGSINGGIDETGSVNRTPYTSCYQGEHNIEKRRLIKTDTPTSFNDNPNLQRDVKKGIDNRKMKQFRQNESDDNPINKLISKRKNGKSGSDKSNRIYKETIKSFNNEPTVFTDRNSDIASIVKRKAIPDNTHDYNTNSNIDFNSRNIKLLRFPHSQSAMKNNDAVFDKLYSNFDNDVLQRNTIRQGIKNRLPVYSGKPDQLKTVNELELKLNKPIQDSYLIDNVLNTQNFIAYLKKTLNNSTSRYKNYPDNNSNSNENDNYDINKYIYKRHASLLPGSEKNHLKKKHKFNKTPVDSSVIRKQCTTPKKNDDYDESLDNSYVSFGKPSKKHKCNDTCETTSECTTTCKPTETTCEQTTTCEPSTTYEPTTCETTACEITTACEESTTGCGETTPECKTSTECKSTTSCEETKRFCDFGMFDKKPTKKRKPCPCKTTCSTTPMCETEEETECEEETTCPTTPKCKTTEQCAEAEINSNDDNGDEFVVN